MKHKLNAAYFQPKISHVCMLCSTPLAKMVDNKLVSLGNKAHVLLRKATPGAYVFHCCKDCAKRKDFSDPALIDAIHKCVVKCSKSLNKSTNLEKPLCGKFVVELNSSLRRQSLKNLLENS